MLYIKPTNGYLTHDTQLLADMDPYAVLCLGEQRKRTRTKKGAGKRPVWDEEFRFNLRQTTNLKVSVYDQDMFSDDLVGSGEVDLKDYMGVGDGYQEQGVVEIKYKGQSAGKVYMMIKYLAASEKNTDERGNNQLGDAKIWNQLNQGFQNKPNPYEAWMKKQETWGNMGQQLYNNLFQPKNTYPNPYPANHYAGNSGQNQQWGNNNGWVENNNNGGGNNDNNGWGTNNNNQWTTNNNNGWGANNNSWGATNTGWGPNNNGWGSNQG